MTIKKNIPVFMSEKTSLFQNITIMKISRQNLVYTYFMVRFNNGRNTKQNWCEYNGTKYQNCKS